MNKEKYAARIVMEDAPGGMMIEVKGKRIRAMEMLGLGTVYILQQFADGDERKLDALLEDWPEILAAARQANVQAMTVDLAAMARRIGKEGGHEDE